MVAREKLHAPSTEDILESMSLKAIIPLLRTQVEPNTL